MDAPSCRGEAAISQEDATLTTRRRKESSTARTLRRRTEQLRAYRFRRPRRERPPRLPRAVQTRRQEQSTERGRKSRASRSNSFSLWEGRPTQSSLSLTHDCPSIAGLLCARAYRRVRVALPTAAHRHPSGQALGDDPGPDSVSAFIECPQHHGEPRRPHRPAPPRQEGTRPRRSPVSNPTQSSLIGWCCREPERVPPSPHRHSPPHHRPPPPAAEHQPRHPARPPPPPMRLRLPLRTLPDPRYLLGQTFDQESPRSQRAPARTRTTRRGAFPARRRAGRARPA